MYFHQIPKVKTPDAKFNQQKYQNGKFQARKPVGYMDSNPRWLPYDISNGGDQCRLKTWGETMQLGKCPLTPQDKRNDAWKSTFLWDGPFSGANC